MSSGESAFHLGMERDLLQDARYAQALRKIAFEDHGFAG